MNYEHTERPMRGLFGARKPVRDALSAGRVRLPRYVGNTVRRLRTAETNGVPRTRRRRYLRWQ